MAVRMMSVVALVMAALSLGPSFAHVLEAPPRLAVWSPELWRAATVFNGQFAWFAIVGAPLDVGTIIIAAALAWLIRGRSPSFGFAVAGAVLLAAGLAAWFTIVAPANTVLATWEPGPIPDNFNVVRWRWESGHMLVAALKLCALIAISIAVVRIGEAKRS